MHVQELRRNTSSGFRAVALRPLAASAIVLLGLGAVLTASGNGEAQESLQIGQPVGRVIFKDVRYIARTLDEMADGKKATVLVFTTTTCPIAGRYLPRLEELHQRFEPRGVVLAAVNVGPEDSIQDMALQALQHGATFPFVKDMTADTARALGISRTPEAVVLDAKGVLRYRGRIDEQFRLGGTRPDRGREDLAEAIEDVLAGRAVRLAETPVDGCVVTHPAAPPAGDSLIYSRDIAPIITRHCAECHQPGGEAPFPLLTHGEVAGHAAMIAEVVAEGRMPPWYAHPAFGKFQNERRLSRQERDKLLSWIRAGSPPDPAAAMPGPPADPHAAPKWAMGEPDLVLEAMWPEEIPADGFIPYRYVILPHIFAEDTWVQGIEILPGNRRVVHHANLGFATLGEQFNPSRNFLTGRVPGGAPLVLDAGRAMLIPRGSILGVQVHYVTTGKPESDRISVGLRFAKEPIRQQVRYLRLVDQRFQIPPGAPSHEVRVSRKLPGDATLLGLFTHMHLRGKDTSFVAHLPGGAQDTLLVVPNYSFDWQIGYRYPPGAKKLPEGTRIECISHFDNSAFNPFNPDPGATVRVGLQTHDEMMEGFVFYTLDEENLNLNVDPRTGRVLP